MAFYDGLFELLDCFLGNPVLLLGASLLQGAWGGCLWGVRGGVPPTLSHPLSTCPGTWTLCSRFMVFHIILFSFVAFFLAWTPSRQQPWSAMYRPCSVGCGHGMPASSLPTHPGGTACGLLGPRWWGTWEVCWDGSFQLHVGYCWGGHYFQSIQVGPPWSPSVCLSMPRMQYALRALGLALASLLLAAWFSSSRVYFRGDSAYVVGLLAQSRRPSNILVF